MSDAAKPDTVHTRSIGEPGRALSRARMHHLVLDSSSGAPEGLTNTEAFLAGISSCGVTLIEKYAQGAGVPVSGMDVRISGIRSPDDPPRFQSIAVRFEIRGVDQQEAERLVGVWRQR
jgi:uncharacterized OsmC-like protein